jgi:hypothetical protein
MPFFQLAQAGQLGKTFAGLMANPDAARSRRGLGMAFQFSEGLDDDVFFPERWAHWLSTMCYRRHGMSDR